jgi:CysZ protein
MLSDFMRGAHYLGQGAAIVRQPGLRKFVIFPIIVNTLIFIGMFWAASHYFSQWMDNLLPDWLNFAILQFILWLIFGATLLFAFAYTFALLANFIAAPFNSLLAEKVEQYLTGTLREGDDWGHLLRSIPKVMASELHKLIYLIAWMIPLFILLLIPALNLVSPFVWFVFGAWMYSLEYADYPMGNHNYYFRQVRQRMRQDRPLALGFGSMISLLATIPVVNIVVMPVAVAGATAMWVKELSREQAGGLVGQRDLIEKL